MLDRIDAEIELTGSLTADQHAKTDGDRREMPGSPDVQIGDQYPAASRSEINSVLQHLVRRNIDYNIIFRQKVCGKT